MSEADDNGPGEKGLRRCLIATDAIIESLEEQELDADKAGFDFALRRLKEMEDELRRSYLSLEQKLGQQTEEARRRAAQLQALALKLTEAEEQERRRLARLLHDGLQQQLVAMRLQLGALANRVGDPDAVSLIDTLDELVRDAIVTSRSLSVEISPQVLFSEGLASALNWLARNFEDTHGLKVDLAVDPAVRIEDERVRVFLFQAAREILFNVVKHARVESARMLLCPRDNSVELRVEDEGCGFEPQAIVSSAEEATGLGLVSIRERGELLGVAVELHSALGRGTRVILRATPLSAL